MFDDTPVGCADGLTILGSHVVATCAGGLCVIDPSSQEMVARLRVPDDFHWSNVAVGGGRLWITGRRALWYLPLNLEEKVSREDL